MPLARSFVGATVSLGLGLGLGGCGPHDLEGSLTELLPLHYQSSVAQSDGAQATVRFQVPRGSGQDVLLEVSAEISDLNAVPYALINLAETALDGKQRGVVSRTVTGDPLHVFPPILRGTLRFDANFAPGASMPGAFTVTFSEGTEFGAGRTVYGDFQAKVPQ